MSNKKKYPESKPGNAGLLNYLIEKTKDAKTPLSISYTARMFKEESGAPQTKECFTSKILTLRMRIHKMEHIDMDTKVRMLFGLSAPVDADFLNELEEHADVTLNDHQRIVEYKKKGGGLELKGDHLGTRDNVSKRDKRIMEFLAQKSINTDSPFTDSSFVREFIEATGITERFGSLSKRIKVLKDKIHESTDFDRKTQIRMMFMSGATVPNDFLELLRKEALVEVDKKNRIVKYNAKDGSLELETERKEKSLKSTGDMASDENGNKYPILNDESSLDNHLGDESENPDNPDVTDCEVSSFKDDVSHRPEESEEEEEFDINIGKLIQNSDKNLSKAFTAHWESDPEYIELVNFVIGIVKNTKLRLNLTQLTEEFIEMSGSSQTVTCILSRIQSLRSRIHKMKDIDTETKVEVLFALSGPIDNEFLEELKRYADVILDKHQRIVEYTKKKGEELEYAPLIGVHGSHKREELGKDEDLEFNVGQLVTKTVPMPWKKKRKIEKAESSSSKRAKPDDSTTLDSLIRVKLEPLDESILDPKLLNPIDQDPFKPKRNDCIVPKLAEPNEKLSGSKDSSIVPDPLIKVKLEPLDQELLNPIDQELLKPQRNDFIISKLEKPEERFSGPTKLFMIPDPLIKVKLEPLDEEPTALHEPEPERFNFIIPKQEPEEPEEEPEKQPKQPLERCQKRSEVLRSIHSLILKMPSLSTLQSIIEQKMEYESDQMIPNDEIISAMDFLVARSKNRSINIENSTFQSISLNDFLCYVEESLFNFDGMESVLERIGIHLEASHNKQVPVEVLESALQAVINLFDF